MKTVPIVYQNDEILIINKPAGVAVQGGQNVSHPLDAELPLQLGYKIYLVHRLDQDTSGLMVVAKNPVAASKWTKLIGAKNVRKEYAALCIGKMKQKKGTICTDVVQRGDEKSAVTDYETVSEWNAQCTDCMLPVSLVFLALQTGRMHQIRIHLAHTGCPVAGDDQHGNFKQNKILRKSFGVKQLMLAAVKLTVPLPEGEKTFSIDLPEHMTAFMEKISAC